MSANPFFRRREQTPYVRNLGRLGVGIATGAMASHYYKHGKFYVTDETDSIFSKNKISSSNNMAYKKSYKPRKAQKPKRKFKKTYNKRTTVQSQLRDIRKSLKSDQVRHTIRQRDFLQIGCNANQCVVTGGGSVRTTDLETAMANLRYYDPAVPGTLVTADASSGTYTRQVHFASVHQKVRIRNNYQIPADVKIYLCTPKQDTNITPESFYSSGVADQTISMAVTSPLLYLNDIDIVRDNWNVKCMKSRLLQPGQEMTASKSFSAFDYDPSNADTHSLVFQKKYRASRWVIRVEGPISHDTIAAQVTTQQSQVDVFFDRKFVITYDAGVNLNDYSQINNASTAFTNAGVVSNKPVSDNQSFSTA